MRSVFIHIGAHKTGTTMVQYCFDRNSRNLKEHGVVYPRSNWYHHSQHRLAFALKGLPDPSTGKKCNLEDEVRDLNKEIDSSEEGSKIFISSEEFFSAPRDEILKLRDSLHYDEIKIIAFVRSPDSLFLSIYNQNTKEPKNKFQRPLSSLVEDPANIHSDMHMKMCIENWASVFGKNNISLHCYEDGSPLQSILTLLNLPADTISTSTRINESVPAAVVEIVRLSKVFDIPPELRSDLFTIANRRFSGFPKLCLSNEDRRKIIRLMQGEMDDLFSAYGRENPYREENIDLSSEAPDAVRPLLLLAQIIEELLKERRRLL